MPRPPAKSGEAQYIRADDMPPLHPDDREAFVQRLTAQYDAINAQAAQERHAKLLSWAHLAP